MANFVVQYALRKFYELAMRPVERPAQPAMSDSDDLDFPPLHWPDPEIPSDEQAIALGQELGWLDENGEETS